MVSNRREASNPTHSGFTLLEVLVAMVLCAMPVVAVQRLMFRTADSVRFATQQALVMRAATNTLDRIHAYHVAVLWPQGFVTSGQWLDTLSVSIASDDSAQNTLSCINRWCSVDQWAAYEAMALGCALNADWEAGLCATIAQTPMDFQGEFEQPYLTSFQASLAGNTSLGVRVRWPKAQGWRQPEDPLDWYQITLGDHP